MLVDVEKRRPIDLLPDREADTLAAWLAERPGIEIVCRDRAPFFADGATRGAPRALQVAGRWHLWHNLGEAAEKCVYRHRGCLHPMPEEPEEPREEAEPAASSPWRTGHRFAERTRAKHSAIHALLAAGHSKRSVARQLGMPLNTILRFSRATIPEEMFTSQWQTARPDSMTTSPISISAGRKAAPTPGNYGRRSRNRAIPAVTPASATTSAGTFAANPNQSDLARLRLAPSPAGSSPTPTPCPKATGSSSRPSWPTAPN
ncbi:transposase [Streptomyces sp. WAC04114]|nr:transposase [Streptomyces sp. WAC04114]